MKPLVEPLYVPVSDSRKVFAMRPATVCRWAKAGRLTLRKVGSVSLLGVSEVEAIIHQRKVIVGLAVGLAPGERCGA